MKGTVTFFVEYIPADWYAKKSLMEQNISLLMESEKQNSVSLKFDSGGSPIIYVVPNKLYYSNNFQLTFPTIIVGLWKKYQICVNMIA